MTITTMIMTMIVARVLLSRLMLMSRLSHLRGSTLVIVIVFVIVVVVVRL